MKKIEELKGSLAKELYENVENLLNTTEYFEYDYLCISRASWEDLFVNIISKVLEKNIEEKDFIGEISRYINMAVRTFIKRKFANEDVTIWDNLLIKLKNKGYKRDHLIVMLIFELKHLNIDFTKDVFRLLQEKSTKFLKFIRYTSFANLSYEEMVDILNKKYKLNIVSSKNEIKETTSVDYANLSKKYADLTFEEIKDLFGENFNNLSFKSVSLLQRFFANSITNNWIFPDKAEKDVNLLIYNYKRKNTSLSLKDLKKVYLANKDKFSSEQALFLECFVFGIQDKSAFEKEYLGNYTHKSYLINKLEMLYYGVEDIFDYTLTKEQYLEVRAKYPEASENFRKDILDLYYGINGISLSIRELSKKFNKTYEEMKYLIKIARKSCLSLCSSLSSKQKVDRDIYMLYALDYRYNINKDGREALILFMNGSSYEEIGNKLEKDNIPSLISKAIQSIDAYRFGVYELQDSKEEDILLTDEEIKNLVIEEIKRHPSESVINESDKEFFSYYYGIKNKYNLEGLLLAGKKLQEKLDFKRSVGARYKDLIKKIKQRKMGVLKPELIVIERNKLEDILKDPHLPITKDDREIICYLLELNGYPLKSVVELALKYGLTSKNLKRKYQIAIININKYLIGEKEGIIDYETDIVPNLKYFTLKEREVIKDYYVFNLTYKDLVKKYNLTEGQISGLMYRIKTTINDIIKNPNKVRFDYDYYYQIVDKPDFPFRGNIELAKRIFSLFVGENTLCRLDISEIKQKLGLEMDSRIISRMIDGLILSVFKYKDGIRKENTFPVEEIKDYFKTNRGKLTANEVILFRKFFKRKLGYDFKISEDLIFLLIKNKFPEYFNISRSSKNDIVLLLKKYSSSLSKMVKKTLMFYAGITERELMTGQEKNHVFRILADLDKKLMNEEAEKLSR